MANSANFQANFPQTMAPFASSIPPRQANRPFVRLSPSECEFRQDFGQLVRLDGQIVFKKSSSQTVKQTDKFRRQRKFVRPVFTICPSETICPCSSEKTAILLRQNSLLRVLSIALSSFCRT